MQRHQARSRPRSYTSRNPDHGSRRQRRTPHSGTASIIPTIVTRSLIVTPAADSSVFGLRPRGDIIIRPPFAISLSCRESAAFTHPYSCRRVPPFFIPSSPPPVFVLPLTVLHVPCLHQGSGCAANARCHSPYVASLRCGSSPARGA